MIFVFRRFRLERVRHRVSRVIPFASFKKVKSFCFFFQKEALVSCSSLEKRLRMVRIQP
jgi:hypothetical protein